VRVAGLPLFVWMRIVKPQRAKPKLCTTNTECGFPLGPKRTSQPEPGCSTPEGWNIPRKKKWRYLFRVIWDDKKAQSHTTLALHAWLDFWTDGTWPPGAACAHHDGVTGPHLDFWTMGPIGLMRPEWIDNTDLWELELQAMSRIER